MPLAIVKPRTARRCGWCNDGHHGSCAIGVRTIGPRVKYPEGAVYLCLCEEGGCKLGRRKCTVCNNRVTEEVDPVTWECFDVEGCRSTLEARRAANPLYIELREAYRSSEMAKVQEKATKAAKAAKEPKPDTFCLCCGEKTKGGLFLPGHDARHVSTLVESVTTKNQTEAQARKSLKDDKVSDALMAKFEKSLALAKERAEKRATAEKEKAAAKAEKAAK